MPPRPRRRQPAAARRRSATTDCCAGCSAGPADEPPRDAAALQLCLLRETLATVSTEAETALALQGLGSYPILQAGPPDAGRALAPRRRAPARPSRRSRCPSPTPAPTRRRLSLRADPGRGRLAAARREDLDLQRPRGRRLHGLRPHHRGRGRARGHRVRGGRRRRRPLRRAPRHGRSRTRSAGWSSTACGSGAGDVLGEVDRGFAVAMRTLDLFRPSVGAFAVGMAQAALDAALDWATTREVYGDLLVRPAVGRAHAGRDGHAHRGRRGCWCAPRRRRTTRARQLRRSPRPRRWRSCSRPRARSGSSTRRCSCTARAGCSAGTCSSASIVRSGRRASTRARPRCSARSSAASLVRQREAGRQVTPLPGQRPDHRGLAALPLRGRRRRRHGDAEPAREDEPAHLRVLRRPARPARTSCRTAATPTVLVIRGEGKGFCGGGDVNEIIGELIKMDAARPDRLHPDDRRRDPGDARVPDPDHRRASRASRPAPGR